MIMVYRFWDLLGLVIAARIAYVYAWFLWQGMKWVWRVRASRLTALR